MSEQSALKIYLLLDIGIQESNANLSQVCFGLDGTTAHMCLLLIT